MPQIIQSSMYSPMTICLQEYEDTIEGENKDMQRFFFYVLVEKKNEVIPSGLLTGLFVCLFVCLRLTQALEKYIGGTYMTFTELNLGGVYSAIII